MLDFLQYTPHSTTNAVAMVLNPYTGFVSLQYHVVFNDHFLTPYKLVACLHTNQALFLDQNVSKSIAPLLHNAIKELTIASDSTQTWISIASIIARTMDTTSQLPDFPFSFNSLVID
jgi:hypothetical protein